MAGLEIPTTGLGRPVHICLASNIVEVEIDIDRLSLIHGRVEAALSVGRSDDLEHARRLIIARTELGPREAELTDLSRDLATL